MNYSSKYRPNKNPLGSKGLYYRPRSLNKDPGCCTAVSLGQKRRGYLSLWEKIRGWYTCLFGINKEKKHISLGQPTKGCLYLWNRQAEYTCLSGTDKILSVCQYDRWQARQQAETLDTKKCNTVLYRGREHNPCYRPPMGPGTPYTDNRRQNNSRAARSTGCWVSTAILQLRVDSEDSVVQDRAGGGRWGR